MSGKETARKSECFIPAAKFADDLDLRVVYAPEEDLCFRSMATNRPGLLFAGFDDYFPDQRIQILGNAEMAYLNSLSEEKRDMQLERLFSRKVPCVIVTRAARVTERMIAMAANYRTALFVSDETTSDVDSDVVHYLTAALAASKVINGELLDISGIGVLLIGESGIGKSETALELVHRGHMLVADDVVEVRRIKNKIYGYPPCNIANLLEVRGVGLIDVEAMYGIGGVLNQKRIHLVIEMERWDDKKSYDRLGDDDLSYDILGVKFQRIVVPVSAGRNLAVVIEAASRNFRLKSMGRDPLEQLSARIMEDNRPVKKS